MNEEWQEHSPSPPKNTVSPFQETSALPLLLNWPLPSPTLKISHRANVYQWQHFSQPTHSISLSHLIFIVSILERFGLLNSGNVSSWNASVLTCCTESLLFLFTRVLLANFYNYSRFYYSNRTRWNTSSKNMSELNISFLITCFWFMQKKINIRVGECAMNPDATQPTQALSFLCQRHRGLFFHFFLVFFFFPFVSGFHFSYTFHIFSSSRKPHSDDWGSFMSISYTFSGPFWLFSCRNKLIWLRKKKSLYSVLQSQHQYLSVIGSSESILCLPTQSLYTHVFPAQKSIWAEGKDCKEYLNC